MESAGAWSPDASLGRNHRTNRIGRSGEKLYDESDENDAQIAERLGSIAEETGATRAQVALAWLLSKPGVAAPIIGASREEQLEELLQAVDLTLKPEQIAEMETPYKQHPVVGFK
jgi:aryl-alcohol dehydrogenase-like predicted oxidoreductase